MSDEYGFSKENEIDVLTTGDGKTRFTSIKCSDGTASIGFSYGSECGSDVIGTHVDHPNGEKPDDMVIKWEVRFKTPETVDALISELTHVKTLIK